MPDPNQNNSNPQNDNQQTPGTPSSRSSNTGLTISTPPASRPAATQERSQEQQPSQHNPTHANNPTRLWVDTSVGRTGTFEVRRPLAPTAADGSDPMRPLESDQQQPTQSQQNNREPRRGPGAN